MNQVTTSLSPLFVIQIDYISQPLDVLIDEHHVPFHFQSPTICKGTWAIQVVCYRHHHPYHHYLSQRQMHNFRPRQQSWLIFRSRICVPESVWSVSLRELRIMSSHDTCVPLVVNVPNQMIPVSLVATGAINEMRGVAKKAISNAFFSNPLGRRDRKDGTTKSHHHQNPNTWMDVSLHELSALLMFWFGGE